jgi:uncharacterized membrane protein YphA (DoxX/SURF4 family)
MSIVLSYQSPAVGFSAWLGSYPLLELGVIEASCPVLLATGYWLPAIVFTGTLYMSSCHFHVRRTYLKGEKCDDGSGSNWSSWGERASPPD